MIRTATTLRLTLAALALVAWTGTSLAQLTSEPLGQFAGYAVHDHLTQTTQMLPAAPAALPVVVYNNTTSPALFAFSSTDLAAVFGDRLNTTGTGTLQELAFSIYNSSSSAGALLTANVGISLYDGSTLAYIGGFSANFNFGTGLPPGYYSIGTVTGLDPLLINLATTNVIVTQTVVSKTGTASRLGIVSFDPPTVGSSAANMYISATTVGPAGWYTIASGNANPGYLLSVASAPVPAERGTWGRLKSLYR